MSTIVNFEGVNEPVAKEETSFKRVTKGAKKLTIISVEDGTSSKGTNFIEVGFASPSEDNAEFKEKFYLSTGALPRVQSLMIGFTGSKLEGAVDTSAIAVSLVGKTSNCIVDARVVNKEVNGKMYANEYATLRFADFASLTTPFKDSDARVKDETPPVSVTNSVLENVEVEDNLPF